MYKERLSKRFQNVRIELIIDVFVYFNLAAIAMCRFYLGRHTLDQIILGLVIGTVNAQFFHEELRPLIFRTLQKPKAKYFWISLTVFVVMFLQVLVAYHYVENYFPIPESWRAIIFSLCKNPRKTQLLHHNNLVCAGYPFFIPVVYFWRSRAVTSDKSFNGSSNELIF